MNIPSLLRTTQTALSLQRNFNCWTAAITRKSRLYFREFPVYLVLPDGSSINIDYHQPRKIITLPLNINTLSSKEREIWLQKRKPIQKAKIVDEFQDDFDATKFYKM